MANNDYITTDCKLTVSKNTAKLDEEIFLYKNDRNIKLLIEIVDNKYRYKSDDLSNLLVKYKASYAQVKWYKNAEVKKEFPIQATDDGKVVFVIEGQLIDEDTELGDYDLQLRLLNESQESIRSLPIIKGAVHILKPLFEEGDIATVNSAVADVSMLSLDGDAIDTYNSDGTYNQTNWGNGDVISSAKLNKLEKVAKDNVDKVNKMPAKSIVEGGKIYLAKEDGTKLDSGTELPAGGSTIEVVNNLESDSTTAALSAAQGKVLNTQCKDIAKQLKNIGGNGYKVYNVLDYNISTDAEDNTTALQTLINTVNTNGGGIIFFPVGIYNFKKSDTKYAMLAKSNVSIIGENIEKTILKCTEVNPYSLFYYIGEAGTPITGCTYSNFTVDGYSTGNTNKVYGKAFFYQYVKDCVFRDLILKGTIATALGIDFLDRVEINNVTCIDCGRTFQSESTTTGTSGIGIGTGGYENENFKITDCITEGCGQYGIFIENQHTLNWGGNTDNPKGCIISNCITRNGLYRGIGVRGGTNVILSNCNSYENAQEGIYLDNKCINVKISNNNVIGNRGNGILSKVNNDSVELDINDNLIKDNGKYGINLETSTNGLMLRHNITKNNADGGLHSLSNITHSNTVAKSNIFLDGEDTTNDLFTEVTSYNDLLKDVDATITSIICDNFDIKVGTTKTLIYSVIPTYANKSKVILSTTDTNYITIDNDAKTITGVTEGTATITLSADGITKTVTITVKANNGIDLVNGNISDIPNMALTSNNNVVNIQTTAQTAYSGYSIRLTDSLKWASGNAPTTLISDNNICALNSGDKITINLNLIDNNNKLSILYGDLSLVLKDGSGNSLSWSKFTLTKENPSQKVEYTATENININYLFLFIPALISGVNIDIEVSIEL